MGYQSKTYSLSDEVVAAIDAAKARGETPSRFLRRILGLDADNTPRRPRCEVCGIGLTSEDLDVGGCPYCKQSLSEYPPTSVPLPTGISESPDYELPPALDSSLTWRKGRKPLEKPKDRKKAAEK